GMTVDGRRPRRGRALLLFDLLRDFDDLAAAVVAVRGHMMTPMRLAGRLVNGEGRPSEGIVGATHATPRRRLARFLHSHFSESPGQEKSKRDETGAGEPASAALVPHDPGRRRVALFGPLVPRDDGQRDYKFILDQDRRHEPIFLQHDRLVALRHMLLERRALEQRHLDLVRDVMLERRQTALAQEVYRSLVLELDDQPAARILAELERGRDDSRIRLQHLGEPVEALQLDLAAKNAPPLPE